MVLNMTKGVGGEDDEASIGAVRDRFVEVDAARLLFVVHRFSKDALASQQELTSKIREPVVRHFTPEYLLQKLDFLLRYPRHLAYELLELHRLGIVAASKVEELTSDIDGVLAGGEPDLRTDLYRKFWHGAYERLDHVESWWLSRRLVYVRGERRGQAPPQKHYFLTAAVEPVVDRLCSEVPHAIWYRDRVAVLHRYFGDLTAAKIKDLQYQLPGYREAQLGSAIPDVPNDVLRRMYRDTLGHDMKVQL